MRRRLFSSVLVLAALTGLVRRCSAGDRPNILFAFADDWGRRQRLCEAEIGNSKRPDQHPEFRPPRQRRGAVHARLRQCSVLHTLPQLAAVGPVLLADRSRRHFVGGGLGPSIPSFPLILKDRGYHIGFTYKVWSPGNASVCALLVARALPTAHGGHFNQFSRFVSQQNDIEAGKQLLYNEVRGNFRDFLKARPAGKPFCYWCGPTNVHRKWIAGSGHALWGLDPDKLRGKASRLPPRCAARCARTSPTTSARSRRSTRWSACCWRNWKRLVSWKTR